jgi:hypothetical protein
MRFTLGAVAVLGSAVAAVTDAAAQPPATERAAGFGAPRAIPPGEMPAVARGAGDDFPTSPYLSSTPVPSRPMGFLPAAGGPAWLTGTDTRVVPAGGSAPVTSAGVTAPPPDPTATAQPTIVERFKGFVGGDRQPAAKAASPPAGQPEPHNTAGTAFRGTGANGAPVYAGPPAYRWYGWGTVTPGANPLAPAGQYPKASANWYSITGATPGAFPVPISNPSPAPPGTDPPTYGLSRSPAAQQPVVPVSAQPQQQPPPPYFGPDPASFNTAGGSKFMPAPAPAFLPPAAKPVSVPTIATPPVAPPAPPVAQPAPPPPAPLIPPPDLSAPVLSTPPAPLAPVVPKTETAAVLPPPASTPPVTGVSALPTVAPTKPIVVPPAPEPVRATLPAAPPKPAAVAPAQLPPSVTENPPREEPRWQPNTEPAAPAPGTWVPSPGMAPLPTTPPASPSWQTGRAEAGAVVARGQLNDETPDPVVRVVKQVCQGRADGVEVRWTGAKKLSVCFEIRTGEEARKLVTDISRRPELTAYQIDFCVLVKR